MNVFVSMTVQCARCHNHKFDPITPRTTTACRRSSRRSIAPIALYDADPAVATKRR